MSWVKEVFKGLSEAGICQVRPFTKLLSTTILAQKNIRLVW